MLISRNLIQKESIIRILNAHVIHKANNSCLDKILKLYKIMDNPCEASLGIKNKHPLWILSDPSKLENSFESLNEIWCLRIEDLLQYQIHQLPPITHKQQ